MTQRPTTPAITARQNQAAAEAIERIRAIRLADGGWFVTIIAIDEAIDKYDQECSDISTTRYQESH